MMHYDKCSWNTILCVICPIKLDCKFLEGKKNVILGANVK